MIVRAAVAALAFAGAHAATASAQHDVQPERPTVATHAGTVAPGWLEIETGAERDRAAGETSFLTPTLFKFGVGSHVQAGIAGSFVRTPEPNTGLGDVTAEVKWRVLDDAPVVGDLALLPAVKLPAGSAARGTGTGTTDASLLLISSHEFGGVSMDLNAGYTRRSGKGDRAPTSATLWTASFGGPLDGSFGWVAEVYGYPATKGPAGQASIVALLAGPTLLAHKWLALDAGVITPLAGAQPHALYAGAVWNVGRVW